MADTLRNQRRSPSVRRPLASYRPNLRTHRGIGIRDGSALGDGRRLFVPLSDITPAFRAMTFTGVQWGAQPCFLPSMSSAKPWLTQWGMAATMPYGNILIPSPGWTDFTVQMRQLQIRREFVESSDDVRFYRPHEIPAWLNVTLEIERDGKRTDGEVVTGAYVRASDSHVLLVVSNMSGQPGAIRFNTAAIRQNLGGKIEVSDALTGAPSMRANADPILKLSIASGTCRFFYICRKQRF